jgi:hypothetical protein
MFRVRMDTENESARSAEAVAAILTDIAAKLLDGRTEGFIRDINGNRIGTWKFFTETNEEDINERRRESMRAL